MAPAHLSHSSFNVGFNASVGRRRALQLAALAGAEAAWMMSTADQQQPNVAGAPWKNNTPAEPPLGNTRAIFRFDGSAGLEEVGTL